eukprot:COSAG01_NODE_2866_length_6949_cov_4.994599_1_plen_34_part_00
MEMGLLAQNPSQRVLLTLIDRLPDRLEKVSFFS